MATRDIIIEGTLDWAKLFEQNRDRAQFHEETDGAYKITVTMNDANLKILKDAGSAKESKKVDGGNQITFSRPHKGREDWMGGPPIVADISGKPRSLEGNGLIGNGSKGRVKLAVFDSKPRNGTRLQGVQITEHVVYESEGNSSQSSSMFEDLSGGQASTKSPPKEVEADSIPF